MKYRHERDVDIVIPGGGIEHAETARGGPCAAAHVWDSEGTRNQPRKLCWNLTICDMRYAELVWDSQPSCPKLYTSKVCSRGALGRINQIFLEF